MMLEDCAVHHHEPVLSHSCSSKGYKKQEIVVDSESGKLHVRTPYQSMKFQKPKAQPYQVQPRDQQTSKRPLQRQKNHHRQARPDPAISRMLRWNWKV
jgi:hypothetical protein